jgi:hypothetical protein
MCLVILDCQSVTDNDHWLASDSFMDKRKNDYMFNSSSSSSSLRRRRREFSSTDARHSKMTKVVENYFL